MPNDDETLGSYGVQEYYTIHCVDTNPEASVMSTLGNLEDVEKYQISEDSYNKRDDTFRAWKKRMGDKIPKKKSEPVDLQEEEAKAMSVGQRCEVTIGQRRGEVKFVGEIAELGAGFWIGI